ncbi:thioredoxin family protein [Poriferisphaera sp. WC338]|uniref:thioredoxin family protein n=1 Tax=Poriferisphaera sp. WC338 TaxID=3425129 RepID=UPI003D8125C2
MDAAYLKSIHDKCLPYDQYAATGNEQQQQNWSEIYNQIDLNPDQRRLLGDFKRNMKVIVVSGVWCGDCVQQVPLIEKIAQGSPNIEIGYIDRDEVPELRDQVTINAGTRVPVVIFLAEDYEQVGWYGDRTLCRYRRMAAQQLGGACPLPGAPVPDEELAESLQCWLNEFERVQLLLRLSGRLREKHGD